MKTRLVQIAFINVSYVVKSKFKDYIKHHEISSNFISLTLDDLKDHISLLSEVSWDLIICDSTVDEADLIWLKSIKPETPFLPYRRHAQSLCEQEVECLFQTISFIKFINYLNDEIRTDEIKIKNTELTSLDSCSIIGQSPEILHVLKDAKQIAGSHANVFISGESGTGKELLAKFIHERSDQKKGPFVAINCTAIPDQLLESELFGHCKGSFTGATTNKIGLFEEANGGTLFLDEIGDLDIGLQGKLLRVLQERKIRRVGENKSIPIDVRIISATHKNLKVEIAENRFREDLYYRLNVVPIHIPALRERPEDIIALASHFLNLYSKENKRSNLKFSKEFIDFLITNPWKGNVRELQNFIEHAVIMNAGSTLNLDFTHQEIHNDFFESLNSDDFKMEKVFKLDCRQNLLELKDALARYIEFAVTYNAGAKDVTARQLGIDRKTLYKRFSKN
jgi:transcriptional regulator with PAS, ATPase and Fis domain